MRAPVKMNKAFWPRFLTRYLPSADDPSVLMEGNLGHNAFSRAISVFKFGSTFKTTEMNRFPLSANAIAALDYSSQPVILDVGASDGVASVQVINKLDFKKYIITDLNTEVMVGIRDNRKYFFDSKQVCILVATKMFVVYSDFEDAIFPLNLIARYVCSRSDQDFERIEIIELVNPIVRQLKGNIEFAQYDIFENWKREKVDVVIAANILNRSYFSDDQLLKAVRNLMRALKSPGRLAVIDNRDVEEATIFRVLNNTVEVELDIHGGTEIRNLILTRSSM